MLVMFRFESRSYIPVSTTVGLSPAAKKSDSLNVISPGISISNK